VDPLQQGRDGLAHRSAPSRHICILLPPARTCREYCPPGTASTPATGEYVDMFAAGIIKPAKVTRSALQNAASIAALFLTVEVVVAVKPDRQPQPDRAAKWTSSRNQGRSPGAVRGPGVVHG
jgi:hypothetical protein